jgi:HK97 family phage major capsid protein
MLMSVRSLELREKAGKLTHEARQINDLVTGDKRVMTAEEATRFDALANEADGLLTDAARDERIECYGERQDRDKRSLELGGRGGAGAPQDRKGLDDYHTAFMAYLADGRVSRINNAGMQIDLDTAGGFIATSERMLTGILKKVDDLTPFRQLGTGYTAKPGETLGQVTLDSDLADDEWGAGEITDAPTSNGIGLGKRELKPRDLKRRIVAISKMLLQSETVDVEGYVQARRAIALARTLERTYMTGDGSNQPLGIFTASADGINTDRDVATGSITGFTADGLIDAQETLKAQYRPNAKWLMHRLAVRLIRKLKDGEGRYLWQPGLQVGQPDMLLNKPLVISEYAPQVFSSAKYAAMYGDFSYYWFVDRLAASVQRLIEQPYAGKGQIGLLFDGQGADGMPILSEAFARMQCAA